MKKSCTPQDSRGRFTSRAKCPDCDRMVCVCRGKRGRFAPCAPRSTKFCFAKKKDLVSAFVSANPKPMQACTRDETGVEFEAINHKYGRKGWRRVVNCEQAVRAVTPSRGPFCFDAIDLKTLNQIDAGRKFGFRLPPGAQDQLTERDAAEHYAGRGDDDDGDLPF